MTLPQMRKGSSESAKSRYAHMPLGHSSVDAFNVSPLASYLVAAVVFINLTRLNALYGFLAALQTSLVLTVLAAVVMFSQASKWRPSDLGKHWISWLVATVLFFAIAGVPTALHRNASFTVLTQGFSQSLLGGVIVFGVARSTHGRRLMAQTLVISGIVTAALALLYGRRDSEGRLGGAATYDANDLALILVITMPLLIWWFFDNRSKARWIVIAALPMMFSIMLRTNSRGGFLGMAAILAGLVFVAMTGRVPEVRRVALTGILLAVIGSVVLPSAYVSRMSTMSSELDNTSPKARINVWKRGIGYAKDNPLLGVGMSNFGRAEGIISDYSQARQGIGVKWSTAHSSYIQAWAEIGLIGGTAFAMAVIGSLLALLLWRPPIWLIDPAARMLTPMVGISIAAFAVAGAFLSFAFAPPIYYLLGFAIALLLTPQIPPASKLMPSSRPAVRSDGGTASKARERARPALSRYPAPPNRRPQRGRASG